MTRVSVYGGEPGRFNYPVLSKFSKTDLKQSFSDLNFRSEIGGEMFK